MVRLGRRDRYAADEHVADRALVRVVVAVAFVQMHRQRDSRGLGQENDGEHENGQKTGHGQSGITK